jgi:hypothetical protein
MWREWSRSPHTMSGYAALPNSGRIELKKTSPLGLSRLWTHTNGDDCDGRGHSSSLYDQGARTITKGGIQVPCEG